jgi:hypothetical protein
MVRRGLDVGLEEVMRLFFVVCFNVEGKGEWNLSWHAHRGISNSNKLTGKMCMPLFLKGEEATYLN